MTQTLYSLKTEIRADGIETYRMTKFVDGEVESSYVLNRSDCDCPAGHRPRCRHRQMLPQMLNEEIANTNWLWDFDEQRVVDFNGKSPSDYTMPEIEAATEPSEIGNQISTQSSWRRF